MGVQYVPVTTGGARAQREGLRRGVALRYLKQVPYTVMVHRHMAMLAFVSLILESVSAVVYYCWYHELSC